jgi:hypothetical protein
MNYSGRFFEASENFLTGRRAVRKNLDVKPERRR